LQSLREAIVKAQRDRDKVYAANFTLFTSLLINPTILQEEREFHMCQRGGILVTVPVGDFEEEEGNNSANEDENEYSRLIASLDLIAENADFVSIK
jgi:hypothetical protein